MSNFILAILLFLTACSSLKPSAPKTVHELKADQGLYSITLQNQEDGSILISSSLSAENSELKLVPSPTNGKIFEGVLDVNGNSWHHAKWSYQFERLYMTPYYSLFAHGLLSRVQEYEGGIFNPNCDVTTKYLLLIYLYDLKIPIFACVI